MHERFSRTAALLGQENIDKLKNRRVAVFGIGGVGGHACEALCRCGVGMIDIFDGDVVDVSNINRQLIATQKTVGRDKVDVMRERLLEINPDAVVCAHKIFYLPETADNVDLSVYDYVIDAVDTITAKLEIICRCNALNVSVISSMGAANKLDPKAFEVADIYDTLVCPMAKVMRKELRKRGVESLKVVYSREPPVNPRNDIAPLIGNETQDRPSSRRPPSSIAFVPPVAGLILASEVVKELIS